MAREIRKNRGRGDRAIWRGGFEAVAQQSRVVARTGQSDRASPLARGIGGNASSSCGAGERAGSDGFGTPAGAQTLGAGVRGDAFKGGESLESPRGRAL